MMLSKNVLLITDNEHLLDSFRGIVSELKLETSGLYCFEYAFSPSNKSFLDKYKFFDWIKPVKVTDYVPELIQKFDVIISLHCKQLFPAELVRNVRCINIHPGLNPNNRGWYPQVFSIINSLPFGATIHEIDEELDHGPVICQKEIKLEMWDTSFSAYQKVLEVEIELIRDHIENVLSGNYKTTAATEGNLNWKKDFDALCEIELEDKDSFRNHINKLRALTHGDFMNAYFIDQQGNKIGVKIELSLLKDKSEN